MARSALNPAALPPEAELRSFARAAAHLLVERQPRLAGARAVRRRAGVGLQHLDHRDYAPGDEVRHIDWRQTARAVRPIVRRFEAETVSDWTLLVDASASMASGGGAKWQAALCAAAALAYALLSGGHRVGLLAFGDRVLAQCPRGQGPHHYAALVRLLQSLQPQGAGGRSEPGVCARHLGGAGSVFTLSDFLAAGEMQRDLALLLERSTALHALQIADDADTLLGEAGECELVDVESGERLPVHAGADAEAGARAEHAAMSERLHRFCRRSGIACSTWNAARPWQPALLSHLLRARAGR